MLQPHEKIQHIVDAGSDTVSAKSVFKKLQNEWKVLSVMHGVDNPFKALLRNENEVAFKILFDVEPNYNMAVEAAALFSMHELMYDLIDRGACINHAVRGASASGDEPLVFELLNEGARSFFSAQGAGLGENKILMNYFFDQKHTDPEAYTGLLSGCSMAGNINRVRQYMSHDNNTREESICAIQSAAFTNQKRLVYFLSHLSLNVISQAIEYAARGGHFDFVAELLKKGNGTIYNAIQGAITGGHIDFAESLVERVVSRSLTGTNAATEYILEGIGEGGHIRLLDIFPRDKEGPRRDFHYTLLIRSAVSRGQYHLLNSLKLSPDMVRQAIKAKEYAICGRLMLKFTQLDDELINFVRDNLIRENLPTKILAIADSIFSQHILDFLPEPILNILDLQSKSINTLALINPRYAKHKPNRLLPFLNSLSYRQRQNCYTQLPEPFQKFVDLKKPKSTYHYLNQNGFSDQDILQWLMLDVSSRVWLLHLHTIRHMELLVAAELLPMLVNDEEITAFILKARFAILQKLTFVNSFNNIVSSFSGEESDLAKRCLAKVKMSENTDSLIQILDKYIKQAENVSPVDTPKPTIAFSFFKKTKPTLIDELKTHEARIKRHS